jgi:hypothetical protein
MKTSGIYLVRACVASGYLYVHELCIACRMPSMGSIAYARLDELRPAQHTRLAALFHLDGPGPTTPAGWKKLVDERAVQDDAPMGP